MAITNLTCLVIIPQYLQQLNSLFLLNDFEIHQYKFSVLNSHFEAIILTEHQLLCSLDFRIFKNF